MSHPLTWRLVVESQLLVIAASAGINDFALGCRVTATGLACGGLPTSCWRPGHFLLFAQEKVTKEKGTPAWRWLGCAQRVREGRPGFSTGHPALAKRNGHPCPFPLRGLVVHPSPPAPGVGRADWLVALRGTSPWATALRSWPSGCLVEGISRAPAPHPNPLSREERELKAVSLHALRQVRYTAAMLLRCAASALSPLRIGALRSAWRYPPCSGGGCQAAMRLTRSGLSHRHATSLRFKPSSRRRVAKRSEVPAV